MFYHDVGYILYIKIFAGVLIGGISTAFGTGK